MPFPEGVGEFPLGRSEFVNIAGQRLYGGRFAGPAPQPSDVHVPSGVAAPVFTEYVAYLAELADYEPDEGS